jgi:membrane-associated phospholipid phosphatase
MLNRAFMNRATLRAGAAGAALALLASGGGFPVGAQSVATAPRPDSSRARPLFGARDAIVAATFTGATILAFPVDKRIARHLENQGAQANKFFNNAAKGFEEIASPGAYIIGGSMYAVGRLGNFGRLADLGLHGTEAVLVGDALTGVLKVALGRSRPFVTADTNPRDFKFGGVWKNDDRTSFPSGHATTAFAAAAAVTAETGSWWPRSTWVVGPLMYGGATMVGLSRMYHNKHWASDVALGAAIGTFSGQKLVQFMHAHPRNAIDRALLHVALAPAGNGGATLSWSMTTR